MISKLLTALGLCFLIFFACSDRRLCAPIDAPATAQGFVSASWAITDGVQLETCALVGASSIALTLHPHGGGADVTMTSVCAASSPASYSVAVGAYDVIPSLLASDGGVISTGATQANVVISSGQIATLDPITFAPSSRTGELALRAVAVGQGTNCQTANGQTIGLNSLAVHTIDGRCVDVSIARSRGGVFVGKYISNCDHPVPGPCFEQDETLTIEGGLEAGPYAITVTSVTDSAVCFSAAEAVLVGAGTSNHAMIQLAPLRGSGC